jgi:hypothetical protein
LQALAVQRCPGFARVNVDAGSFAGFRELDPDQGRSTIGRNGYKQLSPWLGLLRLQLHAGCQDKRKQHQGGGDESVHVVLPYRTCLCVTGNASSLSRHSQGSSATCALRLKE